jgi:hypothetical protein
MKNKESYIFVKWLIIIFKVSLLYVLISLIILNYSDSKMLKETAIYLIKTLTTFTANFGILTLLIYLKEIKHENN